MKPDVQKIFNSLKEDKINLSAYKVSLNIQSDVNKILDELQDALDVLDKYDTRLDNAGGELRRAKDNFDVLERGYKQDANNAKSDVQNAKSIKSKVEAAAKELGVDPNAVKGYNLIDDYIKDLNLAIKSVPSMIKQFKS
jgi:hypothetical protein